MGGRTTKASPVPVASISASNIPFRSANMGCEVRTKYDGQARESSLGLDRVGQYFFLLPPVFLPHYILFLFSFSFFYSLPFTTIRTTQLIHILLTTAFPLGITSSSSSSSSQEPPFDPLKNPRGNLGSRKGEAPSNLAFMLLEIFVSDVLS
jgi:hypothetical protein